MTERSPRGGRLLAAARDGRPLDLAGPRSGDPGAISVAELAEVCLGDDSVDVDRRVGIEVRHARVTGSWEVFAGAVVRFPLTFRECSFDADLEVPGLRCRRLQLTHCRFRALLADGLRSFGDLVLTDCQARRVRLRRAVVRGDLDLGATVLSGEEARRQGWQEERREALNAEGIEVEGELSLRFLHAKAAVNLRRGTIGGRLSALGARIGDGESVALRLEATTVGRNVDLKFGFEAHGGVDGQRLQVGGNLDCRGASMELDQELAEERDALDLRDARIRGDVLLKAAVDGKGVFRRFTSHGRVLLYRATVDGAVECHGAKLVARGSRGGVLRPALDAEEAVVGGSLLLDVYRPEQQPHRLRRIDEGEGPGAVRCETTGAVSVRCARIGQRLSCVGTLLNRGEARRGVHALLADGVCVQGNVDLRRDLRSGLRFEADGIVDLDRAQIGGSLDCGGARLSADEELPGEPPPLRRPDARLSRALVMRDARVANSVYLCPAKAREGAASPQEEAGFEAVGRVNLARSEIGGEVSCWRARFERRLPVEVAAALGADDPPRILNLNDARITGNLDLRSSGYCLRLEDGGPPPAGLTLALTARGLEVAGTAWVDRAELSDCAATGLTLYLEGASFAKRLIHHPRAWPSAGRLHLDGLSYARLDLHGQDEEAAEAIPPQRWVDWLDLQRREKDGVEADRHSLRHTTVQPHERLVEVLRGSGEWEAARAVAIHKRKLEISRLHPLVAGAYRLFQWPIGYGYHPWRVLFLMFLFYAAGVGVFAWADASGAMVPAETSVLVQEHVERAHLEARDEVEVHFVAERYPPFEPLVYSADTFLPIINLHQEDYWLAGPVERAGGSPGDPRGLKRGWEELLAGESRTAARTFLRNGFRVYLWLHIVAGWLLTTIAVAGLSGLVKTD